MDFAVLGWPAAGETLSLDHERFAYAGKFVMSGTGKAVARAGGDVVAAVAFDPDRTDGEVLKLRYVTVREDRQGEGIGPRLLRFIAARASERGFERVVIAVNNPFAYQAAYRAGFGYTGDRTGIAELELARPTPDRAGRYRDGLAAFRERDLGEPAASFLAAKAGSDPPAVLPDPAAADQPLSGHEPDGA